DGAAAAAAQPLGRLLAEQHRAGEVDLEEPGETRAVALEGLLRGEVAGGDDERVEAAQRAIGLVEGGREARGLREVEMAGDHRAARPARGEIPGRRQQLVGIAAE